MSGKIPEEAFRVYCITDPPAAPRIFPVRDGPAYRLIFPERKEKTVTKSRKL